MGGSLGILYSQALEKKLRCSSLTRAEFEQDSPFTYGNGMVDQCNRYCGSDVDRAVFDDLVVYVNELIIRL